MNRKGGVPIGADRDPSKSEICAGNQRDGRKSKGSLFGAESQRPMSRQAAMPGSGYRHNRQPRSQQQMDLFGSGLSNGAIGAPAWPELPAEARAALMSLMTQLILDHAETTATPRAKEVSHDL